MHALLCDRRPLPVRCHRRMLLVLTLVPVVGAVRGTSRCGTGTAVAELRARPTSSLALTRISNPSLQWRCAFRWKKCEPSRSVPRGLPLASVLHHPARFVHETYAMQEAENAKAAEMAATNPATATAAPALAPIASGSAGDGDADDEASLLQKALAMSIAPVRESLRRARAHTPLLPPTYMSVHTRDRLGCISEYCAGVAGHSGA